MAHTATVRLSFGAANANLKLTSGDESRQRLPAVIFVSQMFKGNPEQHIGAEENNRSLVCRTFAAGTWERRRTRLTGFQTRRPNNSVHRRFLGQGSENIASFTAFQESEPLLVRSMQRTKDFSAYKGSPGTMMPDHWLEESVVEIVRNISEAPFIHYVFDVSECSVRTQRQKVLPNCFDTLDRWSVLRDSIAQMAPDGMIFVQRLETGCSCQRQGGGEAEEHVKWAGEEGRRTDGHCERRREEQVWGVVVVGKSITRCACYLLKTTKVASAFGICTRFCVTRASCCGTSYLHQLQDMWLLRTQSTKAE